MLPKIPIRVIAAAACRHHCFPTIRSHYGLDEAVSLGDLAKIVGAKYAWWHVRFLDLADVAVRREVLIIAMKAIERISRKVTDTRLQACINALHLWIDGQPVNLKDVSKIAKKVEESAAIRGNTRTHYLAAAIRCAASSRFAGAAAYASDIGEFCERYKQVQDLIAACDGHNGPV